MEWRIQGRRVPGEPAGPIRTGTHRSLPIKGIHKVEFSRSTGRLRIRLLIACIGAVGPAARGQGPGRSTWAPPPGRPNRDGAVRPASATGMQSPGHAAPATPPAGRGAVAVLTAAAQPFCVLKSPGPIEEAKRMLREQERQADRTGAGEARPPFDRESCWPARWRPRWRAAWACRRHLASPSRRAASSRPATRRSRAPLQADGLLGSVIKPSPWATAPAPHLPSGEAIAQATDRPTGERLKIAGAGAGRHPLGRPHQAFALGHRPAPSSAFRAPSPRREKGTVGATAAGANDPHDDYGSFSVAAPGRPPCWLSGRPLRRPERGTVTLSPVGELPITR